jgi:hypothetical protein
MTISLQAETRGNRRRPTDKAVLRVSETAR